MVHRLNSLCLFHQRTPTGVQTQVLCVPSELQPMLKQKPCGPELLKNLSSQEKFAKPKTEDPLEALIWYLRRGVPGRCHDSQIKRIIFGRQWHPLFLPSHPEENATMSHYRVPTAFLVWTLRFHSATKAAFTNAIPQKFVNYQSTSFLTQRLAGPPWQCRIGQLLFSSN